ncbi:MAG: toll/interleukin-1 receptor domain-containing protein [Alphaproteobacteria bacterium]|nr:toll/interleukin-1 receptor domain-containing protein [Alphaproteobacteria bacterium]
MGVVREHLEMIQGRALVCVVVSPSPLSWDEFEGSSVVLRVQDDADGREALRELNAARDLQVSLARLLVLEVPDIEGLALVRRLAPDIWSFVDLTVEVIEEAGRSIEPAPPRYAFFIAHGPEDTRYAEELAEHLSPLAEVFLDTLSLKPGDDLRRERDRAQRESGVTVALFSLKTSLDGQLMGAILSALQLEEQHPGGHLLVPVVLDRDGAKGGALPPGLRARTFLNAATLGLKGVVDALLKLAGRTQVDRTSEIDAQRAAIGTLSDALRALTPAQFYFLLYRLDVPPMFRDSSEPRAISIAKVLRWAQQAGTLPDLRQALEDVARWSGESSR